MLTVIRKTGNKKKNKREELEQVKWSNLCVTKAPATKCPSPAQGRWRQI